MNRLDEPFSVEVCDLFDDCYEILLQMLARFFAHTEESEDELKALVDAAIDAMFTVIEPLGVYATTLPAGRRIPVSTRAPGSTSSAPCTRCRTGTPPGSSSRSGCESSRCTAPSW